MADQQPVEADPKELEKAQQFWDNFMIGSKYACYGIAAILLVLALVFVDFS